MNWILGLFFIIIIAFLATNYSRKKKTASLKKWLFEHWGKSKKKITLTFM